VPSPTPCGDGKRNVCRFTIVVAAKNIVVATRKTVVPAVMPLPVLLRHDALVSSPARLVLTVEFTAVAETVEGLVYTADHSTHAFSGWSELFAVLMKLTSEEEGN
jgi:hypothetical protein